SGLSPGACTSTTAGITATAVRADRPLGSLRSCRFPTGFQPVRSPHPARARPCPAAPVISRSSLVLASVRKTPFWVQILLALVLGVTLGLVARQGDIGWLSETLTRVGDTFVQLLKLAVPPLVFTAVLVSIANLRNVTGAARLAA